MDWYRVTKKASWGHEDTLEIADEFRTDMLQQLRKRRGGNRIPLPIQLRQRQCFCTLKSINRNPLVFFFRIFPARNSNPCVYPCALKSLS